MLEAGEVVRRRELLEQQVGVEGLAVELAQAAETPKEDIPFQGGEQVGIRARLGRLAVGVDMAQQRTCHVEGMFIGRAQSGQEAPSPPYWFFCHFQSQKLVILRSCILGGKVLFDPRIFYISPKTIQ
jgi:hypothetical protein